MITFWLRRAPGSIPTDLDQGTRVARGSGLAMAECPICNSKVEPLDRFGDAEGFDCPLHGKFRVSHSVLADPDLMKYSYAARWEAALKKARPRAKPGDWPTIQSYDFPPA
jgi:hypothetical protein